MNVKFTLKLSAILSLIFGFCCFSLKTQAQTVSLTTSPTLTSFEGWVGTMPTGYTFSGVGTAFSSGTPLGYKGTNPTSTAGGVYSTAGGGFGYQPASTASALTVTGTYTNNSGATINEVTISYDAIMINPGGGRDPEWNVYFNGTLVSDLTWNSVADLPGTLTATISSISIPDGTDFTLAFESSRGSGSGSSPKIGFDNVTIAYTLEPVDTPKTIDLISASVDSFCYTQGFSLNYSTTGYDSGDVFNVEVEDPINDPGIFVFIKSTTNPNTVDLSTAELGSYMYSANLNFRITSTVDSLVISDTLPLNGRTNYSAPSSNYSTSANVKMETVFFTDPADCSIYGAALASIDSLGAVNMSAYVEAGPIIYNGRPLVGRSFELFSTVPPINPYYAYFVIPVSAISAYNATTEVTSGSYEAIDSVSGANLQLYVFHGDAGDGTTGPSGEYDSANAEIISPSDVFLDSTMNAFVYQYVVTGFSAYYFTTPLSPLNVNLGDINAIATGNSNKVTFITLTESNGDVFIVEKSENGRNFSTLSTIKANGTPSNYEAIDSKPFSTTYYRVKMIDQTTGKNTYSKIVKVNNNQAGAQVSLFPNPTQDWVNIEIKGALQADANVVIYDALGRMMYSKAINENGILKIDVSNYARGLYQVLFQNGTQIQTLPFSVK